MWFNIYTLPKNQGICCEHCGTYIRNVVEIHNSDGFVYSVGLDCFRNLMKENRFSTLAIRTFNKFKNQLQHYDESRRLWESCQTLDDLISAYEKNPDVWLFVMWPIYGWKTEKQEDITQEQFSKERDFILNKLLPCRVESVRRDIQKKFAHVNLKIERQ